jgi:hypothetical protein
MSERGILWAYESLKEVMDDVERRTCSLKKANKS